MEELKEKKDANKENNTDKEQTLIEHIEELRKVLIKCLIAIVIIFIPAFYLSPYCIDFLIKIIVKGKITLNYFAPMEVFLIQLKISLVIDVLICFPYLAKQIWSFIVPALYDNERKFIKNIVFISSFLFIFGVTFCIIFILPFLINFGISFSTPNINPMFGLSNVIDLSLWMSLIFGCMFQIPLVVNMLIKWDIISYESVSSKRSYVIVFLLIFAGLFTPPDIISQLMLFLPTYLLFEFGLLFSKKNIKKENKIKKVK